MKRWLVAILMVMLLCLIPFFWALSETGTVTASSLNMRKSTSSTSDVVKVLKKGTTVTINGSSGSWYKVTVGGKTGYVAKKYISVSSSSKGSSKSSSSKESGKSSSSDGTCKSGDKGESVKKVQKRLKALGYYDGSIDGDYGSGTKSAVKAFQKRNGLKESGEVNSATLKKLNSSDAKKASSSSSSGNSGKNSSSDGTCKSGDKGDSVKKVQKRLKALGYYSGSIDGDFGSGTKSAVKAFQKRNGLKESGEVNSATLKKLNSSDAKKAASDSESSGSTERLDWFNGGSKKIPKGATFKVKDIKTGKVFTVKRWSGYNHIDAEPLTASDTKIMKSIFGHWTWRRRAVLVKYNGHVYAASMNGMPHGTSTISNNNFDGHFCIHFYGSKTHGSGKVDDMHQQCVREAMKHSW